MSGGPVEVVHCALEAGAGGEAPAETSLGDRRKMGVLLQGAGVLCLVDEAGWRLRDPWTGARVDREGLLRGLAAEPGRDEGLPQVRLRALALELFGGESGISGRGEARRSARLLLERWRQEVEPVTPARAVAQVFDAAPFLWREPFGRIRAAALLGARIYGRWKVPWAAGSAAFRSRLAARCADRAAIERVLAGPQARELWEPDAARREPLELAASGRWAAAVRAWERRGAATGADRRAFAEALHAVGRWQDALAVLRGLRSPEARLLRLDCLLRLGRLAGARRALGGLAGTRLAGTALVEAAELAVRLLTNLGDAQGARRWVDEALLRTTGEAAVRARLVAAGSAWDRRDAEALARHLQQAGDRPPRDPGTAWRWHNARALAAELEGDGAAMVGELTAALRRRRSLRPFEAAGLWNELGIGRALCGDLAGAERAFLHALRLQEEAQGPRRTTLALCNLAEIRLRRGRVRGVREILDRSRAENREAGNRRALLQDGELEVRYELVSGRPREALERCRALLASAEAEGPDWRRAELAALAARALGWLGEPAEALRALEEGGREGLSVLEPEERPAAWALAGDRERALAAAAGPTRPLWNAILTGASVTDEWHGLAALEPYRAARLVYDLHRAAPGQVPAERVRAGAVELRRVGALRLAAELEALDAGPWRSLERYLAAETGSDGAAELLHAVVPGGRLVLVRDGVEEVVVDGPGGATRLHLALPAGRLELRCAGPGGPPGRALLRLLARDLPARPERPAASSGPGPAPGIVGRSPEMLRALERIEKLSTAPLPLLVLGETGTGKELFARRAHEVGPQSAGPFVPVNCAELSESLLLSELFGHVRGAFTGADRDRAGIFEAARDGTVFLDEIGDLPSTAQSKLLRVLQEGEVRRVGESLPRPVAVRVVAATHRDLGAMVREGSFREDLYFRLQTAAVELPPLRERGDDLRWLTDHFLRRLAPGRDVRLSAAAWRRLAAHPWPGNVRELRSTLAVAVALADGDEIDERHLELPSAEAREPAGSYHEQVEALRRRLVRAALEDAGGNRAEAARRLGLSRQALSYLVRELGLYTS